MASANLKIAMKCFMGAMQLDENGSNQQAYIEYLSCLHYISGVLVEDAKKKAVSPSSMAPALVTAESQKMMNLLQNCTERLSELQTQLATSSDHGQQTKGTEESSPQQQVNTSRHQPVQTTFLPSPPSNQPGITQVDHPVATPRKPGPKSPTTSTTKKSYAQLSPMEKAYRENRILMEAYSARLRRMAGSKHQSAVNLTFQRRLMENMAIAKEREKELAEKIKERHEHLQKLAAEKFSRGGVLSRGNKELQATYARILEYENVNTWIQEQHEQLRASPADTQLIQNLIRDIVSDGDHPFSQLLSQYQQTVITKLEPLVGGSDGAGVIVPLPDVNILELSERGILNVDSFKDPKQKMVMFNDDFMARLLTFRNSERYEEMLRDVGQDIVSWEGDEMFEELIDELIIESSGDIENLSNEETFESDGRDGIRKVKGNTEETANSEEEETPASVIKEFRDITGEIQDDLDTAVAMADKQDPSNRDAEESGYDEYSVDGDDDKEGGVQYNEGTIQRAEMTGDNREPPPSQDEQSGESDGLSASINEDNSSRESPPAVSPRSGESRTAGESEEEKVERLQTEALERHMENLSKEVKGMIEKLVSLLVAVYDELASAVAKEQCLTIIEYHFFPAVWPMLFRFFRRINYHKEHQVAVAMTRYLHALPEHIGIKHKFCLRPDKDTSLPDGSFPYQGVVQELLKLSQYTCPADKIECLVRVSSSAIECVNDFYAVQEEAKHITVGCDDLLPILSFVLLKSGLPSVISEINAMEMFIQEGYLFGKEGYCLTTMQTALSYVYKLSEG